MTEYIEKEKLYQYLDNEVEWRNNQDRLFALESVSDFPAADVAPVVHGKWDEIPNQYMSVVGKDGSYHGNVTSCSVCHEINPNAYKTNYCPNCGAKMDLEDK